MSDDIQHDISFCILGAKNTGKSTLLQKYNS